MYIFSLKKYWLIGFLFVGFSCFAQQPYKRALQLMGCNFEITVVAENEAKAADYIDLAVGEIQRIEQLISSWDADSQTSTINKNAGIEPVKVDEELFDLIERAVTISKLTDGAFDISYASMDRIWKFDGSMSVMPSEKMIAASVAKVGFENITLNKEENSVYLNTKGMKIGFGAIGKGYAADKAKALLMRKGVTAGIINASGDMNTWGKQTNGQYWKVALTNPMDKSKSFGLLPIKKGAVVTSGNYEKFVVLNNERYAHIIDPRTGYPTKGILSVTIFAAKAELADALATAVFVLGIEVGLDRVKQLPDAECIIIDDKGDIHKTENIKIEIQN